jgi:hypothetical protein
VTEFYETRMGRRFYEHTVPELVRQLDRLNANLERITNEDRDDEDEDEDPTDPRTDGR